MSGMTLHTPNPITPRQRGSWAGRGLLDSLRGLAFLGWPWPRPGSYWRWRWS
jgi:hypothetical protein